MRFSATYSYCPAQSMNNSGKWLFHLKALQIQFEEYYFGKRLLSDICLLPRQRGGDPSLWFREIGAANSSWKKQLKIGSLSSGYKLFKLPFLTTFISTKTLYEQILNIFII